MHKILIGGQALMQLGSTRNSEDIDYLVNIDNNTETFIHAPNADLINANGHPFFKEIWELEKENSIASPQSLLELKAFSFVQHCINRYWQKADDAEYDIKFLVRKFGLKEIRIANKYITFGQLSEVNKVIKSTK
ncbi:MAG: hypothetical protein MUF12_09195 [Sediminibacterium sp.]|jgi:hypothetical protein|nr:hypothetical protein [Sediminibacterium sp.]